MAGLEYTFTPIGVVRGGGEFPQQAPRQSVYARNEGFVELFPHRNFEQALEDLDALVADVDMENVIRLCDELVAKLSSHVV